MKKLLLPFLAAIALMIFSLPALAQTYGTISLTSVPPVMPASASSNVNQVIDCRYNRNVAVSISAGAQSTNGTYAIFFVRSLDASVYESTNTAPHIFSLTCASLVPSVLHTNIDMGGFGWLKAQVAQSGTNGCSNVVVTVALKPGN